MIKYIKGDLIKESVNYNVVIQGCNCFNTMGAGIALQLAKAFPILEAVDNNTKYGDVTKLGNYTSASINFDTFNTTFINAYTQYRPSLIEAAMSREESILFREDLIYKCFRRIKKDFGDKNNTFLFPLIGCGLAGGNWDIVSKIIEEKLKDENLTCIIWDKDIENINKFKL